MLCPPALARNVSAFIKRSTKVRHVLLLPPRPCSNPVAHLVGHLISCLLARQRPCSNPVAHLVGHLISCLLARQYAVSYPSSDETRDENDPSEPAESGTRRRRGSFESFVAQRLRPVRMALAIRFRPCEGIPLSSGYPVSLANLVPLRRGFATHGPRAGQVCSRLWGVEA